jgi:hypothetical protein
MKKTLKHARTHKVGQPIWPKQIAGTLPGVPSQIASTHVQEVATLADLTWAAADALAARAARLLQEGGVQHLLCSKPR